LREIPGVGAAAMQCEAELKSDALSAAVINDRAVTARLRESLSRAVDGRPVHLRDDARWLAAEDVQIFMEKAPGTYMLVGAANHENGLDHPDRTARFDLDQDALPIGAGVLAAAVAEYVLPH